MATIARMQHTLSMYIICSVILCISIASATHLHPRDSIANGIELRILPLGDSITWGEGSTTENGYRLALSNVITSNGNNLTYIGSVKSGTMANNENEGHGGFQILQVGIEGRQDYSERPNIVLFMAGTNDVVFDIDLGNAPLRLIRVIEEILVECPEVTVLVGSLTPLLNPGWMTKINDINAKLPEVINRVGVDRGIQAAMVNMSRVTTAHIHQDDGIHPTDEAYELIAAAWYEGIVEAGKRGWIKAPLPVIPSNETSIQDVIPPKVDQDNKLPSGSFLEGAWSLEHGLIYALLLFGLLIGGRKVAVILLTKFKR